MLTAYKKRMYIEEDGSQCPYCKSKDLEGYNGYEADADYITAKIRCIACKKEWRDLYKLSDIIEE